MSKPKATAVTDAGNAPRVAIPGAKYSHRVTCSVCEASVTKDFFDRHICACMRSENENSSEKAATAPEASHAEQREVSAPSEAVRKSQLEAAITELAHIRDYCVAQCECDTDEIALWAQVAKFARNGLKSAGVSEFKSYNGGYLPAIGGRIT